MGNKADSFIGTYVQNTAGVDRSGFKEMRWLAAPVINGPASLKLGEFETVVKVTIPAGTSRTFYADHVLGGMSFESVWHKIVID